MKKSISTSLTLTVILLSAVFLTACKSVQTATNSTTNHATAQLQRDSIYLHDSIRVEYKRGTMEHLPNLSHSPFIRSPDTVIVDKWHTRWRDRETIRADTITNEVIRTETVQVRYIPRFYKYCAALAIILFLIFLLRVMLYLYRRFH